jgi:2-polyprenyl-6-methoxyphenol hydroxylase-like FAD-dependent oxidoreductase
MPENLPVDVLICGAGASGLTLAIDLARRGVSFRLIEKMDEPFQGSRGKGIQPRTQEVFEDLGILDRVVAAGGPYPPQREYRADGGYDESPIFEPQEATSAEPYQMPLMVPQFRTEGVMHERLAELGHRPQFGCELVDFEQDEQGVTARLTGASGMETLRVRYLIGTDGGRSSVRHTLGLGFPGETLGIRAVVADVMLTGLDRNAWHRFKGSRAIRQISLCPLAGTDLFQLQGSVPPDGDVDLSAAGLTTMVTERTGRADIVVGSVSWASAFSMHARLADRYRVGRVFLAGDAAHVHPPTGGQGLNTSVQDAYNLGWKLAAVLAGAPDVLLDTYEEERRPIAAHMLGLAVKLLEAAKHGEMRRGREVRQLDLGYPDSSLSMGRAAHDGGVAAGDRAPDALVRGAAGRPLRLFDLFKGPGWTLLGCEATPTAIAPRANLRIHTTGAGGDIVDDGDKLRSTYGVTSGDWILIRPDGYIGAIVPSGEMTALAAYFARVGLAAD